MGIYLVMGLSFGVNALLLMGAQRLMGHMPQLHRLLMAAAIGGLYSGLSLLRRFFFLQNADFVIYHNVLIDIFFSLWYADYVGAVIGTAFDFAHLHAFSFCIVNFHMERF